MNIVPSYNDNIYISTIPQSPHFDFSDSVNLADKLVSYNSVIGALDLWKTGCFSGKKKILRGKIRKKKNLQHAAKTSGVLDRTQLAVM